MKKILFVEDDQSYREAMTAVIESAGYAVDASDNPLQAIELFTLNAYDLIISDLKMDSLDGIQFLQYIKSRNPQIKTMILTSAPTPETEMESLHIDVDRYISKDTRLEILLKYIDILLTKSDSTVKQYQKLFSPFEELELDLNGRRAKIAGKEIAVTPKEFGILQILLRNRGEAVSREQILDEIWDSTHETIDPRVIDVHIKEIRRKFHLQSIVSIRGYGYKWDE